MRTFLLLSFQLIGAALGTIGVYGQFQPSASVTAFDVATIRLGLEIIGAGMMLLAAVILSSVREG